MGLAGLHVQSVAELQARLDAERGDTPFLLYRDGDDRQQIVTLTPDVTSLAVGRLPDPGIRIDWDPQVSRVHAVLERVGGAWTVADDGLSRNGTFVNGSRISGRWRLADGDCIRCGAVFLAFRDPAAAHAVETLEAPEERRARGLTLAQRRVLVALCRPLRDSPHGHPATNKQIAGELSLSVDAVKTHLRRIAEELGVESLPQNQKRSELAWTALRTGVVAPRELLYDV